MTRMGLLLAGCVAASPAAAQEARRVVVSPYIELAQVLDADLNSGDVLTYSSIAAGIDAVVQTRQAEGQVSYRYERRIGWGDDLGDSDIHSGLARASFRLTPSFSVEGGAIATRARSDIRGAAPGNLVGDVDNISQVYGLYAGPTLSTTAGPVDLFASYFVGYTKVEVPTDGAGLAPGRPRRDYYDDSVGHIAQVTAGVAAGEIAPVGITLSAAYDREDAGQLDQRYEGYYGRSDVVLPVSRTVALQAGVGYERIESSERAALVAPGGAPVLDGAGRFVTDPDAPRRIAYRTDGIFYDAGVIWRPSRRLELNARIGERYGSFSGIGSLSYQVSATSGLQIGVYDSVQTFGRQLRTGIANLPTSFITQRDAFGQQFSGCTFGTTGAAPGGCLDDVFQSIATASYRARGIDGIFVNTRGRTSLGFGAGYANRKLYTPNVPFGAVLYGQEDESYYAQAFWSRTLTPVSAVDATLFANYYDSAFVDGILSGGLTGSYSHSFGRLGTVASLGLYGFSGEGDDAAALQALLGARYQF